MNAIRREILPRVFLTCAETDKFKTGCLSVSLIAPLARESAARNAVIPGVLRRGTTAHPDMESIGAALDGLYGAIIEPSVRKKGELQVLGLYADFPDDRYVPRREGVLHSAAALVLELLTSPETRGGLLLPRYVEGERDKLLEQIRARVNDKRVYAMHRLFELMCPGESYGVFKLGGEDEANAINYVKLTKRYKELLASSPIEIFYCGSGKPKEVARIFEEALSGVTRGGFDDDLGTDIRMNTVDESTRYFKEEMDVSQGKLSVGFRIGDYMENPDHAALRVFNALYGGSVTSKLFMNVREKLSLCYYASSATDERKGVMAVSSGIEFDKYDAALNEILVQLDAVRKGDVTDDELLFAKRYAASSLRSMTDSSHALEDFYLDRGLDGEPFGPLELAAMCEDVIKDELVAIAESVRCDAVYFLVNG